MSEEEKYTGICVSCKKAPFCENSYNIEHPVWFCDMFNDYGAPSESTTNVSKKIQIDSDSKSTKKIHDTQYKGLCMNCVKRKTCTLPKPEGGVWHCVEYQ